ncbi:hypothetical protein [Shinella sp.]|uniref:hypothetical protein n=1 Tax=Shinella sp. TaxID=1870904 RepID=UPI0040369976
MAHAVLPEFRSAIEALWQSLRLPAPKFAEPGEIRLRVESLSLSLSDSGRGTIVIEGGAGLIANEQALAAAQIRKVLHTNLGFLLDGAAAVYLKPLPNRGFSLVAHASYAYRALSPALLMRTIEDVIRVIEYYSAELKSVVSAPRPHISKFDESEQAVIFRP